MNDINQLIQIVSKALTCYHDQIFITFWDDVVDKWQKLDPSISKNAVSKRVRNTLYNRFTEDQRNIGNREKIEQIVKTYFVDTYNLDLDSKNQETKHDSDSLLQMYDKRHTYLEESSIHIFHLRSAPKPIKVSDTDLKILKKRYSNWDGQSSTINEVCRDFKIPRPWFMEIKTIMGWTHDSDPFLDAEVLEKDAEELIEETLQDRRSVLYQKFENEKYKDTEDLARKYLELDAYVVKPLIEKIDEKFGTYVSQPLVKNVSKYESTPCMAVVPIFDIHVGKLAFRDKYLNIDEFIEDCTDSFDRLYNKLKKFNIEELIIPVGSDFFHVDNMHQSTTKGTLQNNNMGINTIDMFLSGMELSYRMNDTLVGMDVDKIKFMTISGNHDYLLSISLGEILKQRYGQMDNVEVEVDKWIRRYYKYGNSLIGLTHGDELPMSKNNKRSMMLNKFMLKEARDYGIRISDIDNYYYFSGHQHKFDISDGEGVMDIVVPSLAKADFWHHQQGYDYKEAKVASYIFDKAEGLTDIILSK